MILQTDEAQNKKPFSTKLLPISILDRFFYKRAEVKQTFLSAKSKIIN
jgi:hypothetical protein